MTAALKMAAPGELCAQSKKLMAFCKDAKSIKAMKQHLCVTHERMGEILRNMLSQRLLRKQSNGMYKTTQNKLQFIDEPANSIAALADTQEPAALDAPFTELDVQDQSWQQPTEPTAQDFDLSVMAAEFEREQELGDQLVLDNIDAKQRCLNYCLMLLSANSKEMRRCLGDLITDLEVIKLHQQRGA